MRVRTAPSAAPDPVDLAGPGLRTVFRIAEAWGLGNAELSRLLGEPSRSTFYRWKAGDIGPVGRDLIERISYLLGIYKALAILLPRAEDAHAYLRRPNSAPVFGGQSPLQVMLHGQVADLYRVRQYLDAERGW